MTRSNRQQQMLPSTALWLAFFMYLALPNTVAHADEAAQHDPKQWLERMIDATKKQSYEGSFVYLQGQAIEVMHIAYSSRKSRQRMVSLTGPVREVIVKEGAVICLLPSQQITFSTDSHDRSLFPISLPHKLALLESQYEFKVLGDDRVADRKTLMVAIQPRDELRFGYRLWLDYDTGMVLRSAMVDNDGHFLEQLIFTTIDFRDDIEESLLRPRYLPESRVPKDTAEKNPSEPLAWYIGELPPGFKQIMRQRYPSAHASSADEALTEHLVYSDGLATVSVFLEPLAGSQTALLEGASKMDAMNAFGKVAQGYQILVVGEVPALTVERLANAIQPAF